MSTTPTDSSLDLEDLIRCVHIGKSSVDKVLGKVLQNSPISSRPTNSYVSAPTESGDFDPLRVDTLQTLVVELDERDSTPCKRFKLQEEAKRKLVSKDSAMDSTQSISGLKKCKVSKVLHATSQDANNQDVPKPNDSDESQKAKITNDQSKIVDIGKEKVIIRKETKRKRVLANEECFLLGVNSPECFGPPSEKKRSIERIEEIKQSEPGKDVEKRIWLPPSPDSLSEEEKDRPISAEKSDSVPGNILVEKDSHRTEGKDETKHEQTKAAFTATTDSTDTNTQTVTQKLYTDSVELGSNEQIVLEVESRTKDTQISYTTEHPLSPEEDQQICINITIDVPVDDNYSACSADMVEKDVEAETMPTSIDEEKNREENASSEKQEKHSTRSLRKRIRKTLPPQKVRQSPMGLPRPLRIKKESFSLEEIYTNKNYSTPVPKSWETIFEYPKEEKDGTVKYVERRKKARAMVFYTNPSERPVKKRKNRTTKRISTRRNKNTGEQSQTKLDNILAELDHQLKLHGMSP